MTAIADPANDRSTHHVIFSPSSSPVALLLTDGQRLFPFIERRPIEDGTIKMSTGQSKYSDQQLPYDSIVQEDWAGGAGNKDLDRDSSAYLDGRGVFTRRTGEIILGGMPVYPYGHRVQAQNWPRHDAGGAVSYAIKNAAYLNQPFTPDTTITTPGYLYLTYLSVASSAAVPPTITYQICADSVSTPGTPGAVLYTGATVQHLGCYELRTIRIALTGAGALSAGTLYHIKISGLGANVYYLTQLITAGGLLTSANGTSWSTASPAAKLFFRVTAADQTFEAKFFEYKGRLYYAKRFDDGTHSKLFGNGMSGGVATGAQTATTLKDTSRSLTTDEFKGAILVLTKGAGSDQQQNWRQITTNSADTFTVSPAWDTAPVANDTEYAVVAHDRLYEITAFDTNYDVDVRDVLSVNGAVYFANGDAVAMTRLVASNVGGTYTYDFSDLGGYTAGSDAETGAFSRLLYAGDEDGNFVWGAKGGVPAVLQKAAAVDHTGGVGAALTFAAYDGGAGLVGDAMERINGLEQYGEFGAVWVLKDGGGHELYQGRAYFKGPAEMKASGDYRTGKAHCVWSTYLYTSFQNFILRYYNGIWDTIWPNNTDVPLPYNRQGAWADMVSYAGMVIACIDGGANADAYYGSYSSIWLYNGRGWSELYRAPAPGMRIRNLHIQKIPGNHVDRLWFDCGADVMWLPISVDPYNHPRELYNFYPFWAGGSLFTSYHYAQMNELEKYFHSLRLEAELNSTLAGSPSGLRVDVTATTNDDGFNFTYYDSATTSTDTVALALSGYRMSLGLNLRTGQNDRTPRITQSVLKLIKRDPAEHWFAMTALLEDRANDLVGYPDDVQSWLTKYNRLLALENQTAPVTVDSVNAALDGKSVFVNRVTLRPYKVILEEGRAGYIVEIQGVEA